MEKIGENYNWAFGYIRNSSGEILEIGSRDGLDAVTLNTFLNKKVYCFEANPNQHAIIKNNIRDRNIELIPYGVMEKKGILTFYTIIDENVGSSSFFKPKANIATNEIKVKTIRIDNFCKSKGINSIFLACIDVEGGEMNVLKSFGSFLFKTKYIIVETAWDNPLFEGGGIFEEVNNFLKKTHLPIIGRGLRSRFGDVLYVNKKESSCMDYLLNFKFIVWFNFIKHARKIKHLLAK